jgi:hypothetical protein
VHVSFSIVEKLHSGTEHTSWIYNPFNGFELCNAPQVTSKAPVKLQAPYIGYVSNSEWNKGLYEDVVSKAELVIKPYWEYRL